MSPWDLELNISAPTKHTDQFGSCGDWNVINRCKCSVVWSLRRQLNGSYFLIYQRTFYCENTKPPLLRRHPKWMCSEHPSQCSIPLFFLRVYLSYNSLHNLILLHEHHWSWLVFTTTASACMGSAAVFVIVTKCNYHPASLLQHSLEEPHGDSWGRIVIQCCPLACFPSYVMPLWNTFLFVPCQQKRRGRGHHHLSWWNVVCNSEFATNEGWRFANLNVAACH